MQLAPISASSHLAALQSLPTLSSQPLYAEMHTTLTSQQAAVDAAAAGFISAHGQRADGAYQNFMLHQLTGPPASDAPELAKMHELQNSRTAADSATATYYDKSGDSGLWQGLLSDWQHTVSSSDASRGARMLSDAFHLADQVTGQAKHTYDRTRPFAQDSSLKPILVAPVNNHGSYPSQHVTNAFAAAAVLSTLMPTRADEFERVAEQVAFSRVYSNVHFPSDAAAGAQVGRLAADYAIKFD